MKITYILLATSFSANSFASNIFDVELFYNSNNIHLEWNKKLHLYQNTIGYLSTCEHLDKIIAKEVAIEKEQTTLKQLTKGNYLKFSFGKHRPHFPTVNGIQETENIYVGISNDGFPNLITENEGDVQLYAKCQGHYAIINYSCDTVLAILMDFKINHELCNKLQ